MKLRALCLLSMFLLIAGCGSTVSDEKSAASNSGSEDSSSPPTEQDTTETNATDVEIELVSWDDTEKLIAGKKGKVVVVDLWAMT